MNTGDIFDGGTGGDNRTVRPAVPQDAPVIANIQYEALLSYFAAAQLPVPDTFTREHLHDRWTLTLESSTPTGTYLFVATHARAIAGFALAVPAERVDGSEGGHFIEAGIEIAELTVDRNFTRAGHGSRLLHAVADTTVGMPLRVWLNPDDETRIRFFQSAGFAPAGFRRSLGPTTHVQHLWWALNEPHNDAQVTPSALSSTSIR